MKILFVTAVYPHAPDYGAQQRVLNICRQLRSVGKVSIVLVCAEDIDQRSLDKTRAEFEVGNVVHVRPDPITSFAERLRFELDPAFMNTHFSSVCQRDRETLLKMVEENDVVWVHTLRTANECHIYRWPHSIIDMDDIPSRVCASRAQSRSTMIRRWLDYRMSVIWRRRECCVGKRFDVVTVCSEDDRQYFRNAPRIQIIPNGFASPSTIPSYAPTVPPRLGFIGWFGGIPNVDGVEWFLQKIWPLVKRDAPETRLRLVGEVTDRDFSNAGEDIDVLGYIEDPSDEIATWSAMIVPIRIGGGTRVKIAQAFSRRCPVVSTSLGAFGYEVTNGEDIMLADRAEVFAAACVHLIEDKDFATTLSENAWKKFLTNWTWDSIGQAVKSAVEHCVNKHP